MIGVVAWFAGLFYIFRLFVYHTENATNQEVIKVLTVMERRLYYAITMPAMIWTLGMGLAMFYLRPGLIVFGWLHIKFVFLVILFGYHFFAGYTYKRFLRGDVFLTSRQCRLINEIPTLVLVPVVILAIVKPF